MKNSILLFLSTIVVLQCAFSQSKDSAEVYYQKGLQEKTARRWMVAFNCLQKSVQYDSNNVNAERELGLVALELRKYGNAELAFTKVLSIQKNDTTAVVNLANLSFWTHQWKDAITYAQKALQLKAGSGWNYVIGKSYYQQEDYGQAFKYFQAASKEDTANSEIPYLVGRAFVDMNNYKAAVPFFQKAIALDSSKAQWMYELALVLATIPNDRMAIQYYLLAAEKGYKVDNDYYENLADSYAAVGEGQKAVDLMLKALDKKPGDLVLLYSVADAYYHMKKYPEAIDYWDKILFYDKDNSKALYMIGMAYQKKGDTDKGRQLCDRAIAMDPSLKNLKQERGSMGL
ncbi:MAG: tetratricopeptide repeat protein [Bacteroidetes bacterium]|nr:tetratricopeptide repeat protein [Bacteroidota bacterium]MBS1973309.1 tetratricopeptide repeat protein [Bacteroidota bacterium]